MTEQPRTIDRQRVVGLAGEIDSATLGAINGWIGDFCWIGDFLITHRRPHRRAPA